MAELTVRQDELVATLKPAREAVPDVVRAPNLAATMTWRSH